ncbi:hypothetical protein EBR96_10490, partial [bacterium]|nr:hypothetical protein [bacterium]
MKLTISHLTHYQYSSEIRLNPHIVRLRPRSTSRQKVLSFSLAVSPDPVHTTVLDSIDDSLCHRLYFIGPSDSLTINTHSVVIAKPSLVPEDLHLYSTAATLPMVYPDVVWQGLSCFLMPIDQSDGVRQLSQSVAESVYFRTDQFLMELTRRIYQSFG